MPSARLRRQFGFLEPTVAAWQFAVGPACASGLFAPGDSSADPAPESRIRVKIGAKRDGRCGARERAALDSGANRDPGGHRGYLARVDVSLRARAPLNGTDVLTTKRPLGAIAAAAHPQAASALESTIDDLHAC